MGERGYMLIDFEPPPGLWPDRDRVVRFMEQVRANLHRIAKGVPTECEADLVASGHAHNPGLVPLLCLYVPPEIVGRVPNPSRVINSVSTWCASLSREEVERIVRNTDAPAWDELVRTGVHPDRKGNL